MFLSTLKSCFYLLFFLTHQPKILKKLLHTEIKTYLDRIEVLKTLIKVSKI